MGIFSYRSAKARRRQLIKRTKEFKLETDTGSMEEDVTNIQPSKKAQKYIKLNELNTQANFNSFPSESPIETMPASANGNAIINSAYTCKA